MAKLENLNVFMFQCVIDWFNTSHHNQIKLLIFEIWSIIIQIYLNEADKNERQKLLSCTKSENQSFDVEDKSFNYSIKSDKPLTNFSIEIHGINLLKLHQLNKKETIIPDNKSKL